MEPFPKVLIMAAGTGGHVYPALSIAHVLLERSAKVEWLGTPMGMENELLKDTEIPFHKIQVSGLRGSGVVRKLKAPIMILSALFQSISVLREVKPDCVLGMGGFVCGPAGVAAKLLRMPLILHEQNAVAGLTNSLLSKIAYRVLQAFPGTFKKRSKVIVVGNPIRQELVELNAEPNQIKTTKEFNILVLGGSQGAKAINEVIPGVLAKLDNSHISVLHQTGKHKTEDTLRCYQTLGMAPSEKIRVVQFINDMASAYRWADIVVCRSGASTVSEIAAAGKASLLIPYPYHKDNQQSLNARWLADAGAAKEIPQDTLTVDSLAAEIDCLVQNRDAVFTMGERAKQLAICNAAELIADQCVEVANA